MTALPENYRRGLSVTAQTVERVLDEMENVLISNDNEKVTARILKTYDAGERARLLKAIAEMREVNGRMVQNLGLEPFRRSESQILGAKAAHLWTVLVDSTAKGLRGFGELSEDHAKRIDFHINSLLQKLKDLG